MRVAQENPTWGYTRLRGALKNLGHELGRNTIKRILAEHGIAPAPERGRSMSWSTFIKAHWGAIAATDLFTVEVVNPFGLVRYHVLFVIDIATRCVCIGGITSDPNGEWMKQVARNLTDMWDGFLLGKRYLIHDRDPLFTEAVRGLLRDSGVKPLRLPANSPNLNAYAERFVLSIRRECLDRFVPLSEQQVRIRTPPCRSAIAIFVQSKDTADVNGTSSQATPSEAWWRTRSIVTRRSSGRRCGLERWRGNELNTELGARYSTRWLRSGCPIRTAPGDSATGTGRSAICSGPCNNAAERSDITIETRRERTLTPI